MSLASTDLADIRGILKEELQPLQGELKAIRNDIKDIYEMISSLENSVITDKAFKKLPLKKKILTLNSELLIAARQAGVKLPR